MQVKAVLFDFDGVIVQSESFHLQAWQKAIEAILGTKLSWDELLKLKGRSSRQIVKDICEKFHAPQKQQALFEYKSKALVTLNQGELAPLTAGIRAFWAYLDQCSIPFGVASNAPSYFVKSTLRNHKLAAQVVLGYEDYQNPKPSPEPYLKCARELGVSLTDHPSVMVFEDSLHGLAAAKKAGMMAIGVTTGHDHQTLVPPALDSIAHFCDPLLTQWFESYQPDPTENPFR